MSFYGEAELAGLEAQSWAALGEYRRAAGQARRAIGLQDPHFARNTALYGAELTGDLAASGHPDEAVAAGSEVLDLLGSRVHSTRIRSMLDVAARGLRHYRQEPAVAEFLRRGGW
jgi:tetratricopeptide (TPR) repeat protein